jgi:hypothetical protein
VSVLALRNTITEHDDLLGKRLGVALERDQMAVEHISQIGDNFPEDGQRCQSGGIQILLSASLEANGGGEGIVGA